jgi:hypothetical protein
MRIFHFVNHRHGLENLRRRRLKIATINDLNDPFEFLGPASADRQIRKAFQETKNQLAANRGILCFSRNWKNPVLWSHYADRHRGLCLGFEMPDEYLTPVKYSSTRMDPNLLLAAGDEKSREVEMRKILSTKYSHWRYESEVRCFISLDEKDKDANLYFLPFSEQLAIKEVIVGHSSSLSRTELLGVLGESCLAVSISKARLSFRRFSVVRQKDQTLW